jgi:ferrous iron transport protein B
LSESSSIKSLRIALVGNPNSGKSTLFNALTGLHQKTGNYPGVTVDKYTGYFETKNYRAELHDLPGTYSLFAKAPDEVVTSKALLEDTDTLDAIVLVLDASNLKRSLLLATQILDLKLPTIVVLNMMDEAERQNIFIDKETLRNDLGVEIVGVNSRKKEGIEDVKRAIERASISNVSFYDISHAHLLAKESGSFRSILTGQFNDKSDSIKKFESADTIYRYSTINYLLQKSLKTPQQLKLKEFSTGLDKLLTHRIWGYLIFLVILSLIFQSIFSLAEIPMNWIETGTLTLQNWLGKTLPEGEVSNLFVNGIIAGIGGVVMFVPQIALLFLFIGLLEDSGYMARVSFIMDRVMRPFGLNGKSVIPLISGVACAVPSIMGTRTISNTKDRLITILVLPLISCSARLPVYTLLISVMLPQDQHSHGFFNNKGFVLLGLYLLGFVAALVVAAICKKLIRSENKSYFIMELPLYRLPQFKNLLLLVFNKVKVFLKDAGKIILSISIILWFLSTHGPGNYEQIKDQSAIEINTEQALLENSYAGHIGKFIEPVIKPLGFDWKMGIALITSFAAREVFVGTMATIYNANASENTDTLREKISAERDRISGKPIYSYATCWSLLIFYAFAMQCMSTMAVVKRETNSWKWTLIQLLFMSALAYFGAFITFQTLS